MKITTNKLLHPHMQSITHILIRNNSKSHVQQLHHVIPLEHLFLLRKPLWRVNPIDARLTCWHPDRSDLSIAANKFPNSTASNLASSQPSCVLSSLGLLKQLKCNNTTTNKKNNYNNNFRKLSLKQSTSLFKLENTTGCRFSCHVWVAICWLNHEWTLWSQM